ncbi:MAG TPA: YtxH domain-containing protein [Flavobacteriales bacterium]|nr:YtxH domain-containing protein [Flavobacteriales bacterium]HQW99348.1 YtxH domain-containing protein [Flavobacteriales bacterium]HQY00607.1 YtxH domain-containing protein [Flavobacteriales bacterium]
MKRDSKMGLFGLLAGAAIGATVGLLLAPASGKETRKNIKRRAKRAQKDLVDLVEKVRGNAEAAAADAMEDAGKEVSSKAKRAADAVRQSAN